MEGLRRLVERLAAASGVALRLGDLSFFRYTPGVWHAVLNESLARCERREVAWRTPGEALRALEAACKVHSQPAEAPSSAQQPQQAHAPAPTTSPRRRRSPPLSAAAQWQALKQEATATTLHVKYVPQDADAAEVAAFFSRYGPLRYVVCPQPSSQRSGGRVLWRYASVTFEDRQCANTALAAANGLQLRDNPRDPRTMSIGWSLKAFMPDPGLSADALWVAPAPGSTCAAGGSGDDRARSRSRSRERSRSRSRSRSRMRDRRSGDALPPPPVRLASPGRLPALASTLPAGLSIPPFALRPMPTPAAAAADRTLLPAMMAELREHGWVHPERVQEHTLQRLVQWRRAGAPALALHQYMAEVTRPGAQLPTTDAEWNGGLHKTLRDVSRTHFNATPGHLSAAAAVVAAEVPCLAVPGRLLLPIGVKVPPFALEPRPTAADAGPAMLTRFLSELGANGWLGAGRITLQAVDVVRQWPVPGDAAVGLFDFMQELLFYSLRWMQEIPDKWGGAIFNAARLAGQRRELDEQQGNAKSRSRSHSRDRRGRSRSRSRERSRRSDEAPPHRRDERRRRRSRSRSRSRSRGRDRRRHDYRDRRRAATSPRRDRDRGQGAPPASHQPDASHVMSQAALPQPVPQPLLLPQPVHAAPPPSLPLAMSLPTAMAATSSAAPMVMPQVQYRSFITCSLFAVAAAPIAVVGTPLSGDPALPRPLALEQHWLASQVESLGAHLPPSRRSVVAMEGEDAASATALREFAAQLAAPMAQPGGEAWAAGVFSSDGAAHFFLPPSEAALRMILAARPGMPPPPLTAAGITVSLLLTDAAVAAAESTRTAILAALQASASLASATAQQPHA